MIDNVKMNYATLQATLQVAERLAYQLQVNENTKEQINQLQGVISSLVIVADKVSNDLNSLDEVNK